LNKLMETGSNYPVSLTRVFDPAFEAKNASLETLRETPVRHPSLSLSQQWL